MSEAQKFTKGEERERSVEKAFYFNPGYFALPQLFSFSHQIHEIYKLQPKRVLEVGIGNGFTSSFMRRSGIDVYTVDINPNLEPDLVSSIDELPKHLNSQQFDLVVCCEVLEHLPFDKFEDSIQIFRAFSNQLFLTLPCCYAWLGVSGFVQIPKLGKILGSIGLSLNQKHELPFMHFWEIGSHTYSSRRHIKTILKNHYGTLRHGSFQLNRYHEYFICGHP